MVERRGNRIIFSVFVFVFVCFDSGTKKAARGALKQK